MIIKKIIYVGLAGLMIASTGTAVMGVMDPVVGNARRISRRVSRRPLRKRRIRKPRQSHHVHKSYMRRPISYRLSSETKPYPQKLDAKKDRIVVSIRNQRAYLMQGRKLLYEFYVSTGRYNLTPYGFYRIEKGRSKWFYSKREREGAYYAVGWHDKGLYLFHETPSYHNGKLIKSVARDLGKIPSSHGCIHLSASDAKWFYYHAPAGMKVIIQYKTVKVKIK